MTRAQILPYAYSQDDLDRFLAFFVPAGTECWIWQGGRAVLGYGHFWLKGRTVKAHRFSLWVFRGELPGEVVMHACDNPPCVNPAHIANGTTRDNALDASQKNRLSRMGPGNPATGLRNGAYTQPHRVRRGSLHGRAVLTEEQVDAIRLRYAKGPRNRATRNALALEHGVGEGTIQGIVYGQKWTWR